MCPVGGMAQHMCESHMCCAIGLVADWIAVSYTNCNLLFVIRSDCTPTGKAPFSDPPPLHTHTHTTHTLVLPPPPPHHPFVPPTCLICPRYSVSVAASSSADCRPNILSTRSQVLARGVPAPALRCAGLG